MLLLFLPFFLVLLHIPPFPCSSLLSSFLLQDYTSLPLTTQLTLKFQLTSPLPQGSYLRIKLPFSIDKDGIGMSATWWDSGSDPLCKQATENPASIVKSSQIGSKTYFIQFFTTSNTLFPIALSPGTWFLVKINFAQPPTLLISSSASSVVLPPVQLATVGSTDENGLAIDDNANFGILAYETKKEELFVRTKGEAYTGTVGTIQNAELRISPLQTLLRNQRIVLLFSNPKFTFLPSVVLSSFSTSTKFLSSSFLASSTPSSSSSPFSSFPSSSSSPSSSFQMTIVLGEKINQNEDVRISFDFQYPFVLETTDISVLILNQYNNQVLTSGRTSSGSFAQSKSSQWNPSFSKVLTGWGIDLTTAKPPFKIYRNGPAQRIYNNMRFKASLQTQIPSTIKLKVVISFTSNVVVQPSSFSCSFASNCLASSGSSAWASAYYVIICDKVGGLGEISFNVKASFAWESSDSPKSLGGDFVMIEAFPYNEKGVVMDRSIVENYFLSTLSIPISNNLDRVYQQASNDLQPVHSIYKTPSTNTLSTDGFGVKVRTESQYLEFYLDWAGGEWGTEDSEGVEVFGGEGIAGVESYTYESKDCYSSVGAFTTAKVAVCNVKNGLTSPYTRKLQFGVNDKVLSGQAFTAGAYFGFKNILITKHNSLYAEGLPLDFYIGTVSKGLSASKSADPDGIAYKTTFLINSFTVSLSSSLSSMNLAISHFWTSSSGTGIIDGEPFPLFVRLFGKLSTTETPSVNKFFIAVDYLTGFSSPPSSSSSSSTSSSLPSCGSTLPSSCSYLPGDPYGSLNYQFAHKYLVNMITGGVPSEKLFQIVLPMASVASKPSLKVFLICTDSFNAVLNTKVFTFTFTPPAVLTYNLITSSLPYKTITGSNYGIVTRNAFGTVGKARIAVYHTDRSGHFSKNSGGDYGAAFAYVGKEGIYDGSKVPVVTSPLSGSAENEKCLTFKYYKGETKYVIYCPIYQSLGYDSDSSYIDVDNFKFQNVLINGAINSPLIAGYGALSSKNGLLIHFETDTKEDFYLPNKLNVPENSMLRPMINGQLDQAFGIIFNNTNPLPVNFRIIVETIKTTDYFYFSLNEKISCKLKSRNNNIVIPSHTCRQVFYPARIEAVIVLSSTTGLPADYYVIQFQGVSVLNDSLAYQSAKIKTVDRYNNVIDQSLILRLFYQRSPLPTLTLLQFSFLHLNALCKTPLQLFFILSQSLFPTQIIMFSLPFLDENKPRCQITFPNGTSAGGWFGECLADGGKVKVVVVNDIPAPQTLILSLSPFLLPSSFTSPSSAIILTPSSSVSSPFSSSAPSSLPFPSLLPNRKIGFPRIAGRRVGGGIGGLNGGLEIEYYSEEGLSGTEVFYISWPGYYGISGGNGRLAVYIEGRLIDHFDVKDYYIKFAGLNRPYSSYEIVRIELYGLEIPYIDTPSTFFFAISSSSPFPSSPSPSSSSSLLEYGEISDTSNSQNTNIQPITISSFYNDSNTKFSNYHFTLLLPAPPQKYLTIDFPLDFGSEVFIYQRQQKTACAINSNLMPCYFRSLKLIIDVDLKLYANTQVLEVKVENVINVENPKCELDRMVVSMCDEGMNVVYVSTVNFANYPAIKFVERSDIKSWLILQDNKPIHSIQIRPGYYSSPLTLRLKDSSRFRQNLQIQLINVYAENFQISSDPSSLITPSSFYAPFSSSLSSSSPSFLSSPSSSSPNSSFLPLEWLDQSEIAEKEVWFMAGWRQGQLQIGTEQNTPEGEYYMFFGIKQRYGYYADPYPLRVFVNHSVPVEYNVYPSSLEIPINGISLPVTLKTSTPPFEPTLFPLEISLFPALGLSSSSPSSYPTFSSSFLLSSSSPYSSSSSSSSSSSFPSSVSSLSSSSSSLSSSPYSTLSSSSSSTSSSSYLLLSTPYYISSLFRMTNALVAGLPIAIKLVELSTKKPVGSFTFGRVSTTWIEIYAKTVNYAYFFYHISSNASSLSPNFTYTSLQALQSKKFSYLDKNEQQNGFFSYFTPNSNTSFIINNLRANHSYHLVLWLADLNLNESLLFNGTVQSLEKTTEKLLRVQLDFSRNLERKEFARLACFFVTFFVISAEGLFCEPTSAYLNPVSVIPNSASSSFLRSSSELLLHQFRYSNGSYSGYFYLEPLDFLEDSENSTFTMNLVLNNKEMLNYLNKEALNLNIANNSFINLNTVLLPLSLEVPILLSVSASSLMISSSFSTSSFSNSSSSSSPSSSSSSPSSNTSSSPSSSVSSSFYSFSSSSTSSSLSSSLILNVSISGEGLVWIVLELIDPSYFNSRKTYNFTLDENKLPTPEQMVKGFNSTNQTAIKYLFSFVYNSSNLITITNLKSHNYYYYFIMLGSEGGKSKYSQVKYGYFLSSVGERMEVALIVFMVWIVLWGLDG